MVPVNNPIKQLIYNALGLFFSVIPVGVSIFSFFPIWIAREDASILSGISLVLLLLALVPFLKHLKEVLRSASAPLMWFIIFITFMLLSRIADEITVISFVGFVGNLIGSVFFKLARVKRDERRY